MQTSSLSFNGSLPRTNCNTAAASLLMITGASCLLQLAERKTVRMSQRGSCAARRAERTGVCLH